MIVKDYCQSMEKQLAAWQANVQKLFLIVQALPSTKDARSDAKQRENLLALISDIGRVSDMLKRECMPA